MDPIRILIVDDHPIVRQGIRSLLSAFSDFKVVGEADSPIAALQHVDEIQSDIALLDIRLGHQSGIQLARQMRHKRPDCRIIFLTTYCEDEYLFGALEAGAYAYLLKDVALDELPSIIRSVRKGQRFLSPMLVDRVMTEFQSLTKDKTETKTGLTSIDKQILLSMADGLTNQEIARHLHFSEANVKKKVQEILEKLDVTNRTQAVAWAARHGII